MSGRLKNLLILNSGHNIAPEPLEDRLLRSISGAQQVMLFGNGRSYLAALLTGEYARNNAENAIARLNATLPHYRQIRAFHIEPQPLTIESGLLTANGKLRRDVIASHFSEAIEVYVPQKHCGREIIENLHKTKRPLGTRMNNYQGKSLSWLMQDGVVELALHQQPCNEIGTAMLEELEHFAGVLSRLQKWRAP